MIAPVKEKMAQNWLRWFKHS